MPFVPVANTAEVEAVYTLDAQIVENTMYFRMASTPTLSDLNALLEEVNTTIRSGLLPLLAGAIQLIRVVGTLIDVIDGLTALSTTSLPAGGGSGDEFEPSNVAACVSLRTASSGRSFRGRNYIAGLPDGATVGNTLSSTFTTGVLDFYDTLRASVADLGWEMVVVSRFSGFTIVDGKKVPTPREEGIATPITGVIFTDSTVDSQRRRLPGRGR